jgi:YesN/AraC family two-component response regulator
MAIPHVPQITAFVPDSIANVDVAALELELLEQALDEKTELCNSLLLMLESGKTGFAKTRGTDSGEEADFGNVNAPIRSICAALKSNRLEQAQVHFGKLTEILKGAKEDFARDVLIHLTFSIHGALMKSRDADMNGLLANMNDFHRKLTETNTLGEVNSHFDALFIEITGCIDRYVNAKNNNLAELAREYVRRNYHDINLSLGQVAEQANITASYMGKLFKQTTQMTFSDYIKEVRLSKSCELLCGTAKTVNVISELCGFTNSSYFYSVFKKRYGVTPGEFRGMKDSRG